MSACRGETRAFPSNWVAAVGRASMPRRTLTQAQKKRVAAAHAWRCAACDVLLPAAFEVDHVVPLWQGGADAVEN